MLVTFALGAAGSLASVGLFAKGTYTVTPFVVELSATPSVTGETELSVRPVPGLEPGFAQADTHQAPMTFRMTVVGVTSPTEAAKLLANPRSLADYIRSSEEGKDAIKKFGTRLGLVALGGGAAGGIVASFASLGRWRRIVGALISGILVVGVIGLLVHQTYDVEKFRGTRFVPVASRASPR
jgi:hypothetical protein